MCWHIKLPSKHPVLIPMQKAIQNAPPTARFQSISTVPKDSFLPIFVSESIAISAVRKDTLSLSVQYWKRKRREKIFFFLWEHSSLLSLWLGLVYLLNKILDQMCMNRLFQTGLCLGRVVMLLISSRLRYCVTLGEPNPSIWGCFALFWHFRGWLQCFAAGRGDGLHGSSFV